MALIAAIATAALIVSIVAVQSRGPALVARPQGVDASIYQQSAPVTGTGPDLAAFADADAYKAIYESSAPVTGTGPDLAYLAGAQANKAIYENSRGVTGTGPDLARLSEQG